jgi:hypothetical protein
MARASQQIRCLSIILLVLVVSVSDVAACGSCPTPATPPPSSYGKCPKDTLKLGVCANVLGLIKVNIGKVPTDSCCPLLEGLADLEAAVCLCTALKANILGINLDIPVNLSLLLNYCGKSVPEGFQCA